MTPNYNKRFKPYPHLAYPNDRATGLVLLENGRGKYSSFGTTTLKERLEVAAHYSGYGLEFEL